MVPRSTLRSRLHYTALGLGLVVGRPELVAILNLGDGIEFFPRRALAEGAQLVASPVATATTGASVPLVATRARGRVGSVVSELRPDVEDEDAEGGEAAAEDDEVRFDNSVGKFGQ